VFAGLYQQLSIACAVTRATICGGDRVFSAPIETFADGFYFSTTTLATVGFGDIVPVSRLARGLVSLEIVLGVGLLGFILARVSGFTPRAPTKT
jgi:voltage-gated potassium channel Kch